MTRRASPLQGLSVLDLTRLAPGPFCTMVLADLGADVLKVEEAGQLSGRRAQSIGAAGWKPPGVEPHSPFNALGRGKRSMGLNLKNQAGRDIFLKLAERADVVVEEFRPGVMDRLGVGYRTLKRLNPRLIYCAITGYGQTGPYRRMAGHDLNYLGMSGFLSTMGPPSGPPAIPHNLLADFAGGSMHAVVGILAALIARQQTGTGQLVDIAMTDAVVSLQAFLLGPYFATREVPEPGRGLLDGGAPFYSVYQTKDERWLTVAAIEPWFFANLCRILGTEELIERQYAPRHWPKMRRVFAAVFRRKTRDQWFDLLSGADTCVGKVYGYAELERDPQLIHRKSLIRVGTGRKKAVTQVGIACKLSDTPGKVRGTAPKRFADTKAVLAGLGYSPKQIAALRRDGAVA